MRVHEYSLLVASDQARAKDSGDVWIKPQSTSAPMDPARLGRCVDIKPKSTGRIPSVRDAALAGIDVRGPTKHILRACHRRGGIARKSAVRREERQGPRYVMRGAVAVASDVCKHLDILHCRMLRAALLVMFVFLL